MAEEINHDFGDQLTIDQAMQLAMSVAKRGSPFVSPNPVVGCVILDSENRFLSYGYHHQYGHDHAEVDALKKLTTEQLINSQFIVTLEPCAHVGKTPSCAQALSQLKLKKVIYGLEDPNPLVAGKGAEILRAAGIETVEYQGLEKQKLTELCEIFLKNYNEKKVFVSMKVAASLDGQIALKTGESQWITTEASREYVHELRAKYDAIVVGKNTIEIDNPSLNIRHPKINKKNKIIIIDPAGILIQKIIKGQKYKFIDSHDLKDIFFATKNSIKTDFNTILFSDLNDLMLKIWKLDIKSIFIEGGAKTYSEFLKANLIDRLYLFQNCSIIGSANGLSWTTDFASEFLSEKKQLQDISIKSFQSDIFITGRLNKPN